MNAAALRATTLAAIAACIISAGCATNRGGKAIVPAPVPAIWPLESGGIVTSSFGLRGEGPAARHHNGIDIAAGKGTPILATADGVVTFSGRAGAYGRAVLITHGNGIETCYAHLRKRKVKRGQTVLQGQRIGTVGKSGRATGCHLHYEVRVNGWPKDPAPYLSPLQPE